ncbi:MAG: HIT domain-containing protein [Phycisphaerales bacterium]|nr:HIT domain-containing protein [Phycisphaerales bacterium]
MPHPNPPRTGPDAIWAPWRLDYLERLGDAERSESAAAPGTASSSNPTRRGDLCFLRAAWLEPGGDIANHVVVRSPHGLILLNKFPYANGHLLVALGEGRPRLLDYDPPQRRHFWTLLDAAVDIVETALQPQGVNAGINQGRAAGAGVPDHLHAHVVPRWAGDVNFISVVGQIRVVPASLEAMGERLRAVWGRIGERWGALLED